MSIKTLLVEDENAWLFINILAMYNGFEFIRAEDGRQFVTRGDQAVELALTTRPDIILMDLRLPVMSGLEAIRRIREFDTRVPIIAFTAYTDRQTRQYALTAHARHITDYYTQRKAPVRVIETNKTGQRIARYVESSAATWLASQARFTSAARLSI